MKRTKLFILIVILSIIGCQSIDIERDFRRKPEALKEESLDEFSVSVDMAKYLAGILSEKEITNIRTIDHSGKVLMYIVEYSEGWVVISGDMRVSPILAESDKSSFSSEINNPGSSLWF